MEAWILGAALGVPLLVSLERQRRTRRRLERLAITDPLTGVPNRHHIEALLVALTAAARRQ